MICSDLLSLPVELVAVAVNDDVPLLVGVPLSVPPLDSVKP